MTPTLNSVQEPVEVPKGRLVRRADGWWIVGFDCGDMGPYERKADADSDRVGVHRWYARQNSRRNRKPR